MPLYDTEFGKKWSDTVSESLPQDIIDWVNVEKSKIAKYNCSEYCAGIFASGRIYEGATFQICGESQRAIAARATYALANKIDPVNFPWVSPYSDGWWDINNVVLASTTTVDGFLAFAKNISDYCSACAKCCRDHKSAVTPENCATYDFSAGWPE